MTEPRGWFPGSKVPLPEFHMPPQPTTPIIADWDAESVLRPLHGVATEMFLIGAVCKALGRPPITIRRWIAEGHLPHARYRTQDHNGIRGRRLYTRGQIEALIAVSQQHRIHGVPRVQWDKHPGFADDVRAAWAALEPSP